MNDVDTPAAALYAATDDVLKDPDLAPWRPPVGITPRLSDAELVTLATMQPIPGYTSEAKWLRDARAHLSHLFPYLPQKPGYNKRLRKAAGLMRSVNRILATTTSVWSDDRMGRGLHPGGMRPLPSDRQTLRPGGLGRIRLLRQPQPLLLGPAPAPGLHPSARAPRQTLIGDKNYFGRGFERELSEHGVQLLRPAPKGERERPGAALFKPLRQVIESINETFEKQLDLERHRGRTPGDKPSCAH